MARYAVRSGTGFLMRWFVKTGDATNFRVDFRRGVAYYSGETVSVRERVSWCRGWRKGNMLPRLGWIFVGARVAARGRRWPFGGRLPGVVVGEGGHATHLLWIFVEAWVVPPGSACGF